MPGWAAGMPGLQWPAGGPVRPAAGALASRLGLVGERDVGLLAALGVPNRASRTVQGHERHGQPRQRMVIRPGPHDLLLHAAS